MYTVHSAHILSAFVALVVQHEMRLRHTVVCGLSGCTIFFYNTHKQHDFFKELLNIKCVFRFYLLLLYETFLILTTIERKIINKAGNVLYITFRGAFR